jgi:hypothetical protein
MFFLNRALKCKHHPSRLKVKQALFVIKVFEDVAPCSLVGTMFWKNLLSPSSGLKMLFLNFDS